jgi:ectoine hydroxylase-related dioxygenase (phytanoyl-CoA dioxygenase family)
MLEEDVLSYGILEKRILQDGLDANVEELEYNGYTVISSGISSAELTTIREGVDRSYERQLTESIAASAVLKSDNDILRCPLAYDDIFLKIASAAPLMELCRRVIGTNFVLLQQNAIINRPTTKEYQSRWHRDLLYQHFVTTKKLALNALFCVDDFSFETGGTVVLPGTHRVEAFPSSRFVKIYEKVLNAAAGSIVVLDAMLFHRSGYNISTQNRRGVNHVIGRPLLVQQLDLPRILNGKHSEDPFLRRYLGYQWNPAPDVATWRSQRARGEA